MNRLTARATRTALPRCPEHLNPPAVKGVEARCLGVEQDGRGDTFDIAALAAYCQAYGRWVEAEERLRETPML